MITKNDCMSILVRLESTGLNIDSYMKKLIISKDIPLEVLRFIAQNRGIEVSNFYEMLRVNHNKKKSPLYLNIVRDDLAEDEILSTLTSLLNQVSLYGKKLASADQFFKEVRAEEITRVLNNYFSTGINDGCKNLLKLIKSDLVVLEYIRGRRELATN